MQYDSDRSSLITKIQKRKTSLTIEGFDLIMSPVPKWWNW